VTQRTTPVAKYRFIDLFSGAGGMTVGFVDER